MKKLLKRVTVLGESYSIHSGTELDYPGLKVSDGYCDVSIKQIIVRDCSTCEEEPGVKGDLGRYQRQVIRHELCHAFAYESGLEGNSWAENEEIIDWTAIQFPKLARLFTAAKCEQ